MDDLQGLLAQFQPTEEDRKRARQQAIMAASLSLLGRPKGAEYQSIGQAGLLGMGLYNNQLASIPQQRLDAAKAGMGLQELMLKQRAMQDAEGARKAEAEFYTRPPGSDTAQPAVSAATGGAMPKQSVSDQYSALARYLASKGYVDQARKAEELALKFQRKLKNTETGTDPATGQRVRVNFYDDGTHEILRDVGPDQEKAYMADNGAVTGIPLDPFTGQQRGAGIVKSLTPDAMLSSETSRRGQDITVRGQDMTDARQRELNALSRQQAADARAQNQWETNMATGLQVNKLTGETRPITSSGAPIGSEPMRKATEAAPRALAVIDQAEGIIKDATGSYAGAAVDQAARAFGIATPGAQATAKLQALEGALMMAQPRMEGQQSDRDAMLYRQMAGQIGNPTVPQSAKLAALKELRKLHEKYAHVQQSSQPAKNDPLGIR